MNTKLSFIGVGALGAIAIISLNALRASAWGVTIDTNLSVSPNVLSFETVFPQETLFRTLNVSLSQSFLESPIHDDVQYRIFQETKPRVESSSERYYCFEHPDDLSRCYPSLCPYLSKEPDGTPTNDIGVPAFHDSSATSSIARGRLAKSDNDTEDIWTIDLHTPCFKGECAQDWANFVRSANPKANPDDYILDPTLQHEIFGCDLVVKIASVSYANTVTRMPGFWRTHTEFTSNVFATRLGGTMTVGTSTHVREITNLPGNGESRLFGAYYSSIQNMTDGTSRAALDKARMQLLRQLVTAKMNCAAFGCASSIQPLIDAADLAYASDGPLNFLKSFAGQLDDYNRSGTEALMPAVLGPAGSSTSAMSQARANKIFWDNP